MRLAVKMMSRPTFAGCNATGATPPPPNASGGGASAGGDGWHGVGEWHSAGGLKFGSVEVAEARFPLYFGRHEFRPNSGGEGQFTGGAGVEHRNERPAVAALEGDHCCIGPILSIDKIVALVDRNGIRSGAGEYLVGASAAVDDVDAATTIKAALRVMFVKVKKHAGHLHAFVFV